MTMAYKAPKGGVPKDVKPGTNVRFEFVVTPQGDMQLTSIVARRRRRQVIAALIRWSVANRFLVLLASAFVAAAGVWSVRTTPLDAIPDLSDTQVIIRTTFAGQAPQIVEDQVTFPLTTTMLSVPGAKAVRGYSFFGDSFVYVIFEDGTDQYWARSRVLEYLNQVQGRLPPAAKPSLGPDATGVGWIYEYALVDRAGGHDLAQLRALQDWFLKYELKALPNVAEVATVGGMVRQYQVVVDPARLKAYNLPLAKVIAAIRAANQEAGGSVVELAEAEYMVRTRGYLEVARRFPRDTGAGLRGRHAGVPEGRRARPARPRDAPRHRRARRRRRGRRRHRRAALGQERVGDDPGGQGAARAAEARVAGRRRDRPRLRPVGADRARGRSSQGQARRGVRRRRARVPRCSCCISRSALVAVVSLPLGVLAAFVVMRVQGVNANIMSLGGIAIAIGAMVDAAIVMIENAHKKLEAWEHEHGRAPAGDERWQVITDASVEVGPALFFSLVIITLSFVPVFTLEAQEGRMFAPLAFTKTYAMAAAAGLAVTLVPVLMGYFVRGRIPSEGANPLNRMLIAGYRPLLRAALAWPKATLAVAALALAATAWPVSQLGGEFMPPLDEGDLLYMPTALPGLSAGKAGELLQQTDRLIKTVPEVAVVFGKVGRAETATDPAPMEMIETTIRFKPKEEWRPGMTTAKLDRGARPHGAGAGPVEHLGAAHPQPDRHARDRHQESRRHQGLRPRSRRDRPRDAGDRARRQGRARRDVGARRAARRRTLSRRRRRPRGGGALRAQHRGAAGDDRRRGRRREHRRDRRGARAVPDQRPLSARDARLGRGVAHAADRHRARRAAAAVGRGDRAHRRRPADAEERERAADRLGLRGRARPRPRVGGPRRAGDGRPAR